MAARAAVAAPAPCDGADDEQLQSPDDIPAAQAHPVESPHDLLDDAFAQLGASDVPEEQLDKALKATLENLGVDKAPADEPADSPMSYRMAALQKGHERRRHAPQLWSRVGLPTLSQEDWPGRFLQGHR